jgi:hypothetical protein
VIRKGFGKLSSTGDSQVEVSIGIGEIDWLMGSKGMASANFREKITLLAKLVLPCPWREDSALMETFGDFPRTTR